MKSTGTLCPKFDTCVASAKLSFVCTSFHWLTVEGTTLGASDVLSTRCAPAEKSHLLCITHDQTSVS